MRRFIIGLLRAKERRERDQRGEKSPEKTQLKAKKLHFDVKAAVPLWLLALTPGEMTRGKHTFLSLSPVFLSPFLFVSPPLSLSLSLSLSLCLSPRI
jgi:hypothetical protein